MKTQTHKSGSASTAEGQRSRGGREMPPTVTLEGLWILGQQLPAGVRGHAILPAPGFPGCIAASCWRCSEGGQRCSCRIWSSRRAGLGITAVSMETDPWILQMRRLSERLARPGRGCGSAHQCQPRLVKQERQQRWSKGDQRPATANQTAASGDERATMLTLAVLTHAGWTVGR